MCVHYSSIRSLYSVHLQESWSLAITKRAAIRSNGFDNVYDRISVALYLPPILYYLIELWRYVYTVYTCNSTIVCADRN